MARNAIKGTKTKLSFVELEPTAAPRERISSVRRRPCPSYFSVHFLPRSAVPREQSFSSSFSPSSTLVSLTSEPLLPLFICGFS